MREGLGKRPKAQNLIDGTGRVLGALAEANEELRRSRALVGQFAGKSTRLKKVEAWRLHEIEVGKQLVGDLRELQQAKQRLEEELEASRERFHKFEEYKLELQDAVATINADVAPPRPAPPQVATPTMVGDFKAALANMVNVATDNRFASPLPHGYNCVLI